MLTAIKKVLPSEIKKPIRNSIKFVKYNYRKVYIQNAIKKESPLKIIVGAAETYRSGWYSTNEQWLDITNRDHWHNIFGDHACLSHIVAEHVFEHLTYEEAQTALSLAYKYLTDEGRIRIAVPDGYNPNPVYLEHVKIAGIGDDAADHKQLLNVDTISALMQEAGFTTEHLEGYTRSGDLVQKPYDSHQGFIMRSRANDDADCSWTFPDAQTSLIVDGIKQTLNNNIKVM